MFKLRLFLELKQENSFVNLLIFFDVKRPPMSEIQYHYLHHFLLDTIVLLNNPFIILKMS